MATRPDDVLAELQEVRTLLQKANPSDAEARLRSLLGRIDDEVLAESRELVVKTIDEFLPKRRKDLIAAFNQRQSVMLNGSYVPLEGDGAVVAGKGEEFQNRLATRLDDLSDHHIFQWATAYRDVVRWTHAQATESFKDGLHLPDVEAVLRVEYRRHAKEIFEKGHAYISSLGRTEETHIKSINGLQRFLDLLIESYALLLAGVKPHEARVQRALTSVLLASVLEGFSLAVLGAVEGARLLSQYPRLWLHSLGFLKKRDLDFVLNRLPVGELRNGLGQSLVPVIEAIDKIADSSSFAPHGLPRLVESAESPRRLEVKLDLPPSAAGRRYLAVQVYLTPQAGMAKSADQLTQRGQIAAVGPFGVDPTPASGLLRPDEYTIVDTSRLDRNSVQAVQRLYEFLHRQLSGAAGQRTGALFNYNVARDFPLKNPRLQRYFHVHRASVQRLFQGFEGKSGVRLWCSVRRSGKTTACFDLAAATASEVVVRQTCDDTEVYPGAGIFYELFEQALGRGDRIAATFFRDAVQSCAAEEVRGDTRVVFVLDEYETLFNRMRHVIDAEPGKRYTVVQPLINQMAGFARDNLMILIGQRPDAHFIMMDQNQLSPYVEQDAFPLFHHQKGSLRSEFQMLLSMILTENVRFTPAFADAVHAESGGHPYLTANLMVHFLEWLITKRKPRTPVELKEADFHSFAETELAPAALSTRSEYEFFLHAVGEALGGLGRRNAPWLHAVHAVLRQIALDGPTQAIPPDRVDRVLDAMAASGELRLNRNEFLRMAQLANFLSLRDGRVGARIPLLARLCAASLPATGW